MSKQSLVVRKNKKVAKNKPKIGRGRGRPVKYTREFCMAEMLQLLKWLTANPANFAIKVFCNKRGYSYQEYAKWCEKHPELSSLCTRAREVQEMNLLHLGLDGTYREGLVKLFLTTHHGYADRQTQDVTTEGSLNITTTVYSHPDTSDKVLERRRYSEAEIVVNGS